MSKNNLSLFASLFLIGFALLSSARSEATTFDGCYQLYRTGGSFPVVCLSGTEEEGINGSNARLAIFTANTINLANCFRASSLQFTSDSIVFKVKTKLKETELLRLENMEPNAEGLKVGKSTFLKDIKYLSFIELSPTLTKGLEEIAGKSDKCK